MPSYKNDMCQKNWHMFNYELHITKSELGVSPLVNFALNVTWVNKYVNVWINSWCQNMAYIEYMSKPRLTRLTSQPNLPKIGPLGLKHGLSRSLGGIAYTP
jgi:hypothetical protein